MKDSEISWTDDTVNPWIGCSKVSEACTHCYAETMDARFKYGGETHWGKDAPRFLRVEKAIAELRAIEARGMREGRPRRVFIASMADVFEDRANLDEPRKWLWNALHHLGPGLIPMLLTKRPEVMAAWAKEHGWPERAWAGTTVENQKRAEERIPHLLRVPASVRFLSCEPLLGAIDLTHMDLDAAGDPDWCQVNALTGRHTDMGRPCRDAPKLGWVICGGESGPHARPMHPAWARALRDQCARTGVAYHLKQWGEWADARPYLREDGRYGVPDGTKCHYPTRAAELMQTPSNLRLGKKAAGRLLDGVEHNGVPA